MPQSVDPRETTPHTIPRVDLKNLRDYELKPVMLLYPRGSGDVTAGCHCVLRIELASIIAENPTVDIEGRLFVDYDVAVPSSQRRLSVGIKDPGDFQSTKPTRGPFVLTIDADAIGLTQDIHVFELVLAEREGFAVDDNVFPPQRATNPQWESSLFKFVVRVQPDRSSRGELRRTVPVALTVVARSRRPQPPTFARTPARNRAASPVDPKTP